jgi:hypothetical protein
MYFAFTDESGADFFAGDSRYSPNKTSLLFQDRMTDEFESIKQTGELNTFQSASWPYSAYFDYGNGDRDTIRIEWQPPTVGNPSLNDLQKMNFYFNGDLAETWDFVKQPDLREQLLNRNVSERVTFTNDPIVIRLTKKLESIEFN